jgi:3,4-dihydroxy 2-butanone 4-phosphate synthase/GTP cyclohydrolase II
VDRIEDILEDIRNGRMVIMMDDEDRENEGDLIMAADKVRAEDINFMARNGRGLICLTLTQERCRKLRLPLMVSETNESLSTNFTVSIEAAEGVTTGISAHDRAHTIRTAVAKDVEPHDLVQPGHIFPLMAQPGGVLTRAGHTEAGCDLARLADCEAAAVIVEILNDDGTMARLPDLRKFAKEHNLKIGTIADLIRYRMEQEKTVEIIGEQQVSTEFGEFRAVCFEDHISRTVHFAMVKGDIAASEPTLVRVHVQDTLSDVLGLDWRSLGRPLRNAMRTITEQGGVLVILRPDENPGELVTRFQAGDVTADENAADGATVLRTYGVGAQILSELGVKKMRVLSAPKRMQGISGFGLEVVEYVDSD